MKKYLLVGLGLALSGSAFGQTWTEIDDADEVSPQVTIGTGPLTSIVGSTNQAGDPGADLFCIRVTDWSTFSASLAGGAAFDTQLFLFTAGNLGIACNDDASGTQSILPAGDPIYAGRFNNEIVNIAVSGYNRDPSSAGGLIFPNTFTGVQGPTGPGGGQELASWSGAPATGDYTLVLTGATYAVPEPGSLSLLALGAIPFIRRR